MKYRYTELMARKDVGASGTEIIDINIPDPITKILVRMEGIVPAAATCIEHPATMISKIELLDGSDVLYSATGLQAQAIDHYDSRRDNLGSGSLVPAWGLIAIYNLNFGRYMWDEQLAFDPKKFKNPQMRITYDEDAPIADIAANYLSVIVDCFDQKLITPTGFLMNKTVKEYNPTANGTERVELPRDYPIRKVYVQARKVDKWLGAIVAHIEIEEDNRKHVILDMENEEFEYLHKQENPMYHEHFVADLDQTTGKTIWHAPTQGITVDGAVYCASAVLNAVPFGPDNDYKCASDIGYQAFRIKGHIIHGVLCFPMGEQADIEDWWQAHEHDNTIRVKGGADLAGTETFYIMAQQYRTYF